MDAFLSKFDSNGNFKWARSWGGSGYDSAGSVAVDPSGNVVAGGAFDSMDADFDPGPGKDIHASNGDLDAFISKFTALGNFLWAQTWGSSDPSHPDITYGVAMDSKGNAYATGMVGPQCDLDPGPGVDLQNGQMFFSKFDSNGVYQWAKTWAGSNVDSDHHPCCIKADTNDNLYICGAYINDTDFDPGPGIDIHTGQGSFLSMFDSSGNYVRCRTWGATSAFSCAVDNSGNELTTGYSEGADYDPGPGTHYVSNANGEFYLLNFDSQGNFQWVDTWGTFSQLEPPFNECFSVACDPEGFAYVAGSFENTGTDLNPVPMDFDPGPGFDYHVSIGGPDAFLSRFDPDGTW